MSGFRLRKSGESTRCLTKWLASGRPRQMSHFRQGVRRLIADNYHSDHFLHRDGRPSVCRSQPPLPPAAALSTLGSHSTTAAATLCSRCIQARHSSALPSGCASCQSTAACMRLPRAGPPCRIPTAAMTCGASRARGKGFESDVEGQLVACLPYTVQNFAPACHPVAASTASSRRCHRPGPPQPEHRRTPACTAQAHGGPGAAVSAHFKHNRWHNVCDDTTREACIIPPPHRISTCAACWPRRRCRPRRPRQTPGPPTPRRPPRLPPRPPPAHAPGPLARSPPATAASAAGCSGPAARAAPRALRTGAAAGRAGVGRQGAVKQAHALLHSYLQALSTLALSEETMPTSPPGTPSGWPCSCW